MDDCLQDDINWTECPSHASVHNISLPSASAAKNYVFGIAAENHLRHRTGIVWTSCIYTVQSSMSVCNLCFHLATSEMWCWSGWMEILAEWSLCFSVVYRYNAARCYEQFLQVSWLGRALNLFALALVFQTPLYLCSSWCYIYFFFKFATLFYLLVSWSWWGWLTRPS